MGLSATQLARIQSRAGEQRLSSRRRLEQPFPVELLPDKSALLCDLSEGGLCISRASDLAVGTTASIRFQFPETTTVVDATGIVSWSDSGRTGVRFTRMEPGSVEALQAWLMSRETAEDVLAGDGASHDSELTNSIASLQEISDLQALISSRHLDEAAALDLIVRRTMELTRATGAAIVLREDEDAVCKASAGNAPDVGVKLSSASLTGECLRTGAMVVLRDSETDHRVNPEICRQLNFRSLVIMPVISDEETVGIVEVLSPEPSNFQGGDVLVLSSVAELIVGIAGPARQETPTTDVSALELESILHSASESLIEIHPGLTEPEPELQPLEEAAPYLAVLRDSELEAVAPQPAIVPSVSAPAAHARVSFPKAELPPIVAQRYPQVDIRSRRAVLAVAIGAVVLLALGVLWFSSRPAKTARALNTQNKPAATTPPATTPDASPAHLPAAVQQTSLESNASVASQRRAVSVHQGAPSNKTEVQPERPQEIQVKEGASVRPATSDADSTPEAPAVGQIESHMAALPLTYTAPVFAPSRQPAAPIQSNGVTPGRLLRKVAPKYPEMALRAGVSGEVVLTGTIGTDGTLHNLKVVSGSPLLQSEAVAAAKQWRYTPYLLDGKAIETDTRITISFHH